ELAEILRHHETPTAIIDVRPVSEFSICALPASTNIPLPELTRHPERYLPTKGATYVVCRLGNDSQVAVEALKRVSSDDLIIKDLYIERELLWLVM
ncbi:Urmylation protein, partial [Tulasnella sp. 403]